MDVPEMASCVPGIEQVVRKGNDTYAGQLRVKLGPLRLTLRGTMQMVKREPESGHAAIRAEARDGLASGFQATAEMQVTALGPERTELVVSADVRLTGILGELGQPLIRKKAAAKMAEFAKNATARLAPSAGPSRRSQASVE